MTSARARAGPGDETPPAGWLVPHSGANGVLDCGALEPDLPDLTGYINHALPEGRTGGAQ